MISFLESGLRLDFDPAEWAVRKYDGHTYYQGLSGAGLKGVDFIAMRRRQLLLLEVKNYSGQRAVFPSSADLAADIQRKIEETFTGIDAIRQMLERKWLFRLALPLLAYVSAQYYEWPFWATVARLGEQPGAITTGVILEGLPDSMREDLQCYLDDRLAGIAGKVVIAKPDEWEMPGLLIRQSKDLDL